MSLAAATADDAGTGREDEPDPWEVEFAACAADFGYFVDTYLEIDDTQGHGDGSGVMPFRLWPAQVNLAWTISAEQLLLILKARQMGITWECVAYALWLALFWRGKLVLFFSQGQDEADEMLRRFKSMYERIEHRWPGLWARLPRYSGKPNTSRVHFDNGSRVKSLPATKKAGRSEAASLVIADEFAFMEWAEHTYEAFKPTIDGGGKLIILSTANGVGNLFHRLWKKARAGLNDFRAVFLPWWSRPGRSAAWYAKVKAEADDPDRVKQEYPSSAIEAFLASGRVRFPTAWVDAQVPNIRAALPRRLLPDSLRNIEGLSVYTLPADVRGLRVAIGADVAEGLEHGDYCHAVVADVDTMEQVAALHGLWEPGEFARHLKAISDAYDAPIVVERNNHGHAVILALQMLDCDRIASGDDEKLGFKTDTRTKPLSVDGVAERLRDGTISVRDEAAIDELREYRKLPNGKTGAPDGQHDDRVMAWAVLIGWTLLVGWEATVSYSSDPFRDVRD